MDEYQEFMWYIMANIISTGGIMGRNQGGWGIFFVFGAILGAFMALMFATDEKGQTKDFVKVRVKSTKTGMSGFKEKRVDPGMKAIGEKTSKQLDKITSSTNKNKTQNTTKPKKTAKKK